MLNKLKYVFNSKYKNKKLYKQKASLHILIFRFQIHLQNKNNIIFINRYTHFSHNQDFKS